ncbi:MAG: class B sortase [Lachnospiraceae bacterium]|nr:class B sortase [Lachnospiraceae bacterium]
MKNNKKIIYIVLLVVFSAVLVFAIIKFAGKTIKMNSVQKEYEKLAETVEHRDTVGQSSSEEQTPAAEATPNATESQEVNISVDKTKDNKSRFVEVIRQNSDFAAWIYIPDTRIDYPVMLRPEDPNYYLHRDFYGRYNDNGAIYIGKGCDLESDNIMIHGHHLNNGSMFGELSDYKKESFYKEHPVIYLDTVEKDGEYDVVAVCREQVYEESVKGVFKYYKYGGKLTKDQYDEYVSHMKKDSFYDTGITPEYGQQLITLSTCSYVFADGSGRFIVVAVKRDDND